MRANWVRKSEGGEEVGEMRKVRESKQRHVVQKGEDGEVGEGEKVEKRRIGKMTDKAMIF